MKKKVKKEKKTRKVKEQKKDIKIEEIIKGAEKEIKRGEEEQFDFEEFLEEPEFQRASPSLGKINRMQRSVISLEEDLPEAPSSKKESDEDSFKYSLTGGNAGDSKYQNYESEFVSDILPGKQIENLGKENLFERREIGFMESPETKLAETTNFEKYNPAKRMEKEELGKESIFERKEIKYKPLK